MAIKEALKRIKEKQHNDGDITIIEDAIIELQLIKKKIKDWRCLKNVKKYGMEEYEDIISVLDYIVGS